MCDKKIVSAAVLSILLIAFIAEGYQAENKISFDEEMQIHRAVTDFYFKGLKERDFSLIRTICVPGAVLMSAGRDGKLRITTLDKWSKRFDPENPPFKSLAHSIVKVDREGTAAQVKILFIVDGKNRVIDYLHLLKIEGTWRIVNIIDF